MNIKKQIRNLYIYEVISGLQITDVVWVFFLLQRGFSLAEVGIAEGVFHIVSMCCEIPSGMLSDTMGRRKTLMVSGMVSAMGALCMILTDYFPVILLAMVLNAFSYNLVSGTQEALTYDSLVEAGQAQQYLLVSSRQAAIYQAFKAVTSLMSLITVSIGYQKAYMLSILQGLLCVFAASRLKEARINGTIPQGEMTWKAVEKSLKQHFRKGLSMLRDNGRVRRRMAVMGLLDAGCYIVFMLMQEHLINCGLDARMIGIPMLFLYACMMLGAFLAEKTKHISLPQVVLWIGVGTGVFICISGSHVLAVAVLASGTANCLNEIVGVRLGNENQKEFTSEIRATMVSVGSMVFSICMAVLSPSVSTLAKYAGVTAAFAVLGIFTVSVTSYLVLVKMRRE